MRSKGRAVRGVVKDTSPTSAHRDTGACTDEQQEHVDTEGNKSDSCPSSANATSATAPPASSSLSAATTITTASQQEQQQQPKRAKRSRSTKQHSSPTTHSNSGRKTTARATKAAAAAAAAAAGSRTSQAEGGGDNVLLPAGRWGHTLCTSNDGRVFLYGGQGEDQLCKDAFWVQDGGGWGIELHVSLLVSASVCMLLIQVIIGSCHPDLLPHSHTHTHTLSLSLIVPFLCLPQPRGRRLRRKGRRLERAWATRVSTTR